MVEIKNLSAGYGGKIKVNNINLKIKAGEKIAILGPNGSGKSTLLKSMVGLIDYSGEVILNKKNLRNMSRIETAREIAFMSQINNIYFSYTVFETVMLGRYAKNKGSFNYSSGDKKIVEQCLKSVNLLPLKNRQIATLSGGELQRVFLAKVFAQDPNIIALDEPTNHLDLKHQVELADYLTRWSNKSGRTVIMAIHDINLGLNFADKILLLDNGSAAAFEPANILAKDPRLNSVYGLNVREHMFGLLDVWI